ncbi:uncharacterized protein BDR25DRAFT_382504 [Lindgomyces ingoldianus]|uniref:Uncharacterized protein n=1 Tax=Lindgomyces ingoldianus TaxID=673940 RepID=A0ACB6RAW7_9PLEO|nr:uncharacterized protein BDR25DRAFT_382504 [Lindgomyces ingoldianus]KAF2475490.1 hypothetical protein BDR25DRAFT_382504 [Lindgomyces ingoldianus]
MQHEHSTPWGADQIYCETASVDVSPTNATVPFIPESPETCRSQPRMSPLNLDLQNENSTRIPGFRFNGDWPMLPAPAHPDVVVDHQLDESSSIDLQDDSSEGLTTVSVPDLIEDRQDSWSSVGSAEGKAVEPWSKFNLRLPGISCRECGASFTGEWQKGNHSRHVRHKHAPPQQDPRLQCEVCHKWFHRSDAKKEHQRKKHGDHGESPPRMTHVNESNPASSHPDIPTEASLDRTALGAWINSQDPRLVYSGEPSASPVASVLQPSMIFVENPYIPKDMVSGILRLLDPRVDPTFTNRIFNGLDLVIGNLFERFPNDPLIIGFIKALRRTDLGFQLCFASSSSSSNVFTHWTLASSDVGAISCANGSVQSTQSPGQAPHPSSSLLQTPYSPPGGISNSRGKGRSGRDKPQNSIGLGSHHPRKTDSRRLLACPNKKHCEADGQRPLCRFEGAVNMWGVMQHLRSRDHRHFLPSLSVCRMCWKFSTHEGSSQNLCISGNCKRRPQPRGPRVAEHWRDLFREIYPESARIPNPYVDDPGWTEAGPSTTANSVIVQELTQPQNDLPFLGDGLGKNDTAPFLTLTPFAPRPNGMIFNPEEERAGQIAEAAAMEVIQRLCNSFQSGSDSLYQSMDQLMSEARPLESPHLQELSDRFRDIASDLLARLRTSAEARLQLRPQQDLPHFTHDDSTYFCAASPFQSSPDSFQDSTYGSWLKLPLQNDRHSSAPPSSSFRPEEYTIPPELSGLSPGLNLAAARPFPMTSQFEMVRSHSYGSLPPQ